MTEFAEQPSLHPGIVVSRLQHQEVIPMNWMNDLRQHFQWIPSASKPLSKDDFSQAVAYVLDNNEDLYERLF